MFDGVIQLVSAASAWAYLAIALIALLDAVIPLVPSETAVITAGVVAAAGDLALPAVALAAAGGALAGDNGGYLIGRRYGARAAGRLGERRRVRERLAWAEHQLRTRGGELIAVGRFVPGGRTAVTLTAGTVRFPWRRFFVYDVLAATGWALYASLLGYVGGEAFERDPWKGLTLALGLALAVAVVVEAVRWRRRRSARPR